MKLKAVMLALFALGIAAALAVSAPASPGKGKPTTAASTGATTGTTTTTGSKGNGKSADKAAACKPNKAIVLKGTYVAAGTGGFAMAVTSGNHAAKGFVGKQATVLVNDKTRVTRRGKASAADLKAGDKLVVQGRACKADAATGAVLAQRVTAKPAKADDGEKAGTTTGTTTG